MKKAICIAAVIGMGLAITPWAALAQSSAIQKANTPTKAVTAAKPAIPVDQLPTKEQLAKLFRLMRVQDQIASMAKMMPALMQQQMTAQIKQTQQANPEMASRTAEQQQAFTKIMEKFMGQAMNLISSDEMIADMTKLYQKHMTRSDVDGIIAFYSSPAGQHLLDKQPVILQEYLPMVMQRMQDRTKPLADEMIKEMKEVTKSKAPSADKPKLK